MKKKTIFISIFLYSNISLANLNKPIENLNLAEDNLDVIQNSQQLLSKKNNIKFLEITDKQLIQQPELLRKLINQVLDYEQLDVLPQLLELYTKTENPDNVLINYAKAKLLLANKKSDAAIKLLRTILAEHKDYLPIRLLLAQALYMDYQNDAALDQFQKLRSENLPRYVVNQVDSYINALQQRESWSFGMNFSYLQENNVNNASKSKYIKIGSLSFKKSDDYLPKSAKGVYYGLNFSKNWNVWQKHALYFSNNFSAKQYWNNHNYDDINNRTELGYQYQSNSQRFAFLPFYEQRWFAGHRYNKHLGVRLEYNQWLSEKWRSALAIEQGKIIYRPTNESYNGYTQLYSSIFSYSINANGFVYLGGDFYSENTREKYLSYKRYSGRVGWGKTWWKGISSRIQLDYAYKNYQGPNAIFKLTRKDREYGATITLWKQDWYFWGITPKISWSKNKVKSNLNDLYGLDKQRVYLNFETTF